LTVNLTVKISAASRRIIKVSDMSRVQRFAAAISLSDDKDRTREIALPHTPDAMSQMGIPMIANGAVHGVLFAESRQRHAFSVQDEAALAIVARQAAAAMALAERMAAEQPSEITRESSQTSTGAVFRVTHHRFDDSVFIDNTYVIKGVPGRLLMFMLEAQRREGRLEFTNRELRPSSALKLPDIKDNLETRLILLRRRLEEKASPVRLIRTGRGRIELRLSGRAQLEHVE
jgi:adenylate cyclase